MADVNKTVEIIFGAVDKTGGAIGSVGKGLNDLESQVGNVTGPLANLATTALKTEAAIVTMAAAMAGVAINEAGEFKTATAEIGTLFNGTSEQVAGLSDEIIAYARTSTSSFDEINESVYKAISTGTDYTKSVELVRQAEVLATGGRANLADVTAVLTSSLNAYGDSTAQAADYADALFVAVQTGNTTLPELATHLGKVTSLGNAAGVPFDDLAAALSALTITAGDTAISSTLLKAVMNELVSPSDELREALDGVTVKGDGVKAVFEKLQEATGGEAEKMSELFTNTRAMQAALILSADASGAFASALDAQADRSGKAQAANDALATSFESTNQNLLNNLKATLIDAGSEMLDGYKGVATALGDVFKGVSLGFETESFQKAFDQLDGFADDVSEKLRAVAAALPEAMAQVDFSGLFEAFGFLGDELSGLFGELDLTTAEGLATAIQAVVDSIETLTRVSGGIVSGLQPFIDALGDLITYVNETEDGAKNLGGEILGFATGLDALLPALGGVGDVLTAVGGGLALIGGAKMAGAAAAGLASVAAVLAGPAGLVALIGGAAVGIGTLLVEFADWVTDSDELAEATAKTNQALEEQKQVLAEMEAEKNKVTEADKALAEAEQKVADVVNRDANLSYEEQVERLSENARIKEKLDAINGKTAESEGKLADGADRTTEAMKLLTDQEKASLDLKDQMGLAMHRLWIKEQEQAAAQKELAETTEKTNSATDKQTEAQKKAADEMQRAAEQALNYQLELDKLASNERIRSMELNFELNLEKLKNEGEKAKAIIENIGTTVESTGDLIGGLFDNLASGDLSRMDELDLERQIEEENRRRDEALELQHKLTEAQTEMVTQQARLTEARADAIKNGDNVLKLEAVGLTPALELVFDEIMKYAQIRASSEGAEFLLGL